MEKTLAQPFADLASSNADVLVQLYRICLETGERLARLQYEAATALGAESAKSINGLFGANDTQDYDALRVKWTDNSIGKTRDFLSNFYQTASEAQAEIAQLTEKSLARFNQTIVEALSNAAKDVPGAEIAATALQTTVGATAAAVLNLAQATKLATDLAESGQAAVSETAKAGRSHARKQA
jgi:phasin family protein